MRTSSRLGDAVHALARSAKASAAQIEHRFTSPLHQPWMGSVLGISLGVCFTICMLTGLIDYAIQHPPSWFGWPSRPVNLFRITEGIHVVTGIASIPLLLAKLWVVYPRLFAWPPFRSFAHLVERLSLFPLVAGSLFLLFTGVLNIDYWYGPMPFFFPTAHFWAAWITIGALVVHIGAKATETRMALGEDKAPRSSASTQAQVPGQAEQTFPPEAAESRSSLSRRGFLGVVGATSAVLAGSVVGEAVAPLRSLAVLAPRNPTIGPQHLPVNQSAVEANVVKAALDPNWRLTVTGRCRHPQVLSVPDLQAMPQRHAGLPISCVEGWSASASWRGVPLMDVLRLAGARPGSQVRVQSLEAPDRLYSSSVVDSDHSHDPDTLLALELNGHPLDLDHGYPLRLIAPNRPGVMQTKWISRLVVL